MRAKGALKPHTADRVRALVPKFVLSLLRLSTDCFTSLKSQPEARKAFLAIVSSAGPRAQRPSLVGFADLMKTGIECLGNIVTDGKLVALAAPTVCIPTFATPCL